jgi:hypothetical protein
MDLSNPQSSERFSVDPTPEDVTFLETLPNLSPTCYDVPRGCLEMDLDIFQDLDPLPDFWLYIDNGATNEWDGFFTEYIGNITTIMGKPPIFIDTVFEDGYDCRQKSDSKFAYQDTDADECYSRSLIDVHKRLEELSIFLGIDLQGTDSFSDGQQEMCEAAGRFALVAEDLHKRGVRVSTAWFDITPDNILVAPLGVYADAFSRTLEELGLPLVHNRFCIGKSCNSELYGPDYEIINSSSWFVDCQPGQALSTCNDQTLYNVDFWLLGGREITDVQLNMDFFESQFPDKAILAGQFSHIPLNDGTISYHNIARFLNGLADELDTAKPLHDRTGDLSCANVDVTSNEHTSAGNAYDFSTVEPRQVACFNEAFLQQAYFVCPVGQGSSSTTPRLGLLSIAYSMMSFAVLHLII